MSDTSPPSSSRSSEPSASPQTDASVETTAEPKVNIIWMTPRWFRLLGYSLHGLFTLIALIVTFLLWAWRGGEGNSTFLYLLFAELAAVAAFFAVGRTAYSRLLAKKYALLTSSRGMMAAAVLLPILAVILIWPGLSNQGEPVQDPTGRKVAVVGAGTAGLHAAWMLDHAGIEFDVYEAADYIGGHAYSPVYTPETGQPFACDVGFIFGSPTDYQEMKVLMDWYGVERNASELSMSGLVDGHQWGSGPDISAEAIRFQKLAQEQHTDPKWNLVPFKFWLSMNGFDEDFKKQYLTPLMSVLFITDLGLYEISSRFMLSMAAGRIQWVDFRKGAPAWTVKGGSVVYYNRLSASFSDKIKLKTPVSKITRRGGKVHLEAFGPKGKKINETYDDVILAVPADVAHSLLQEKDWLEDFVLGEVRYLDSEVVLHTDESLLPEKKYLRHYNYFQDTQKYPGEFELTGVMNWVHGAGEMSPRPIGSLNPLRPIDPEKEILRRGWRHHGQDLWHLAMMLEVMPKIQGRGGVWYAGDWVTVIGHGPAMRTGMAAACNVGAKSRVRQSAPRARCIDTRVEEDRAGKPAVDVHLCGEEEIFEYLVERNCNGFKL